MVQVTFEVDYDPDLGPRLSRAIELGITDVNDEVGQFAYDTVQAKHRSTLRNPTGHLQSRVQRTNRYNETIIGDGGVVYSTWIEGVSRRNATTRFRGYHAYREAAAEVQRRAADIAERVILARIGAA